MARKRKSEEAPMSFFSFQDIVACTTGIMVLLTLMLTMELLSKTLGAEQQEEDTSLTEALKETKARRDELKERIRKGRQVLSDLAGGAIITKDQIENLEKTVDRISKENTRIARQIPGTIKDRDDTTTAANSTQEDIKGLKPEVEKLAAVAKKMEKQPKVTMFDRANDGKRPLWVECSKELLIVSEIPSEGPESGLANALKRFDGTNPVNELLVWAKSRSPQKDKFVLLVRPGAVGQWELLKPNLKGMGFKVGTDVWVTGRNLLGKP